jgi:FAD/FMN-containing dehydrogenase
MSSHMKGLALDAIIGATVVLANGTAVDCSDTQNSDLLWAVKGAGSSFGVVTSFRVNTFAAPSQLTWFTASTGWSQSTAAAGMQAFGAYVNNTMPAELNMRLVIQMGSSHLEGVYWGNSSGLSAALSPLLSPYGGSISSNTTGGWIDSLNQYANNMALDQSVPYNFVSIDPYIFFQIVLTNAVRSKRPSTPLHSIPIH